MIAERNVPLQSCNSFGIVARAQTLVRVRQPADVQAVLDDPELGPAPKFVLGGGSNIVLTGDVRPVVLKVELTGRRLVADTPKAWIVEAGAGENWHDFVAWTLEQGWPGLENLAMIPGTVGASPVQNIGAYGVEVQDRFESLDAVDLTTGQVFHAWMRRSAALATAIRCSSTPAAAQRPGAGGPRADPAGAFRLAQGPWKPVLGYLDLERKRTETGRRAAVGPADL
jgi:UDP-N-acetylmuramate dehydrogenase